MNFTTLNLWLNGFALHKYCSGNGIVVSLGGTVVHEHYMARRSKILPPGSLIGSPATGMGLGVRTLLEREKNNSFSVQGEFWWDGALEYHVAIDPENELAIFYAQKIEGTKLRKWLYHFLNLVYASV